ncbi:hypothetical protein DB32_000823 [Sandaracinus amylolyticus]|uniref:Uncharacterized protein n=1 Tax=Sandaracinus amylolyticus TaxID=927083 RepID=A0A0F6SDL9_9BACT|nr:hypothetical protein DB32_000823 [Sandaracinus amylolyticus]
MTLGVLIASSAAAQDRARDLSPPYRGAPSAPSPPRPPLPRAETAGTDEVQELTAQPAPGVPTRRVYGDGQGHALGWDDPELDLQPRGYVHLVMGFIAGWYGGTASFDEAFGGGYSLAIDVLLEPRASLHLRLGANVSLRTETRRTIGEDELRSSVLSARGVVLLGVHLAQLVALRAGIEVGEGHSFVLGVASGATIGFAFVGQAGIRFGGGMLELGIETAAELREGNLLHVMNAARSIQELAPRVSGYLGLTL